MRFLTWANDPSDPRCELLFASARHFGIEIEPIGVGKEYRGGVSKIEWLAEYILPCRNYDDMFVCIDSFDSMFVREVEGIIESIGYRSFSEVLYAGERWKRNRPCLLMNEFNGRDPYCFPNAGIVAGPGYAIHALYRDMHRWSFGSTETREQWFVSIAFDCHDLHLSVDSDSSTFYCCGGEWKRFAGEVVDGRFRNKRTGTYPYILHAPIPRRSLPIRERIAKELGII